jgi:hypothetical protein
MGWGGRRRGQVGTVDTMKHDVCMYVTAIVKSIHMYNQYALIIIIN